MPKNEIYDSCAKYPQSLMEECWDCPNLKVFILGKEVIAYCMEFGRLNQERVKK